MEVLREKVADQERLLELSSQSDSEKVSRMRLEMDCPLSLWQMPFDTQTCMFDIGLYRSRATDVVIQWQNDSKGVPSGWDWTDKVGLPVAWKAMTLAAEHTIDADVAAARSAASRKDCRLALVSCLVGEVSPDPSAPSGVAAAVVGL